MNSTNSTTHFDVGKMLKRLSVFANIEEKREKNRDGEDDDIEEEENVDDDEEEEDDEREEEKIKEKFSYKSSSNKFEDIFTIHNKNKYSINNDNEDYGDELTVTNKKRYINEEILEKNDEFEYEDKFKVNISNYDPNSNFITAGTSSAFDNDLLVDISYNDHYLNPISINTDLTYSVDNQMSPNQKLYEIANELEKIKKDKDKIQEELNNQKFIEKINSEKIQLLTKENENYKCELYHMKKLRLEAQDEKNNSGFVRQIETLQVENQFVNNSLKKALEQINNLENQMGKLKKYEIMFKSMDLLQVNQNLYQLIDKIGKGGFSDVFCCISFKDKKTYALKKVTLKDLGPNETNQVLNEIELLKKLKESDKVIKLIDHEYLQKEKILYVVMEMGACDLNVIFKKEIQKNGCVKEPKRVFYWQKMLEAVKAIHSLGVIHSDLKPSNFLVVNDEIKLIDFNISNDTNERTSITIQTECGTIEYMAPETFLKDNDEKSKMNKKVDIWSMGVILYLLIYGKLPLQHIKHQMKKMYAICDPTQQDYKFLPINDLNLYDTLKKCFAFKPEDRYDVDQLLSHSYITSKT